MSLLYVLLVFVAPGARPVHAAGFELSEKNERIMKVLLTDRTVMDNGLVCHQFIGVWMLPLRGLVDSLELAIQVSPALSRAEGFVVSESNKFRLDLAHCQVEHDDKLEAFPCDGVAVFEDDIYVMQSLLEMWLPLRFQFNPYKSEIVVDPKVKLPVQARKDRDQLQVQNKSTVYDPGYPRLPIEHEMAEGPFLDQQLALMDQKAGGTEQVNFTHDTTVTGQLLGTDALGYLGGTASGVNRTRLTFSQRSPEGGLLGPYINAREVQVFDVNLPPIHLTTLGGMGRGVMVSSRPLVLPTDFSNQDFAGILLPGWEVQLFRNGILLDRKVSDGSGQFLFTSVPLQYGKNTFLLSYYGPQGQRREEPKVVWIGPGMVQPSSSYFRFALSGIGNISKRVIFDYNKSLFKNLTATTGFSLLDLPGETTQTAYGVVGLNGYFSNILASAYVGASSKGGTIGELGLRTSVLGMNLGALYTRLNDFRSEVFNPNPTLSAPLLVSQEKVDLAYLLPMRPVVAMTWEAARNHYANSADTSSLSNRLSTMTGPVFWNHELTYIFQGAATPLTGALSPFIITGAGQIRATLAYDNQNINSLETEWQNTFRPKWIVKLGFKRHYIALLNQYRVALSKAFGPFITTTNFDYTDPNNYTGSVVFSYSLARDSAPGGWHMDAYPQAEAGAASVFVFIDENRNGFFDPGEVALTDVGVHASQKREDIKTDAAGIAFIPHLSAYNPVDISVSVSTLTDPFLRPTRKGVRIYPQPGKAVRVQVPLVSVGAIDGLVTLRESKKTKLKERLKSIKMELRNPEGKSVQLTRVDRDGFYSFDEVPPGTYFVGVAREHSAEFRDRIRPEQIEVEVPKGGAFESGKDFVLE